MADRVPFDTGNAANIGAFDVTPAWEKPCPMKSDPVIQALADRVDIVCNCGACQNAAAGHW